MSDFLEGVVVRLAWTDPEFRRMLVAELTKEAKLE